VDHPKDKRRLTRKVREKGEGATKPHEGRKVQCRERGGGGGKSCSYRGKRKRKIVPCYSLASRRRRGKGTSMSSSLSAGKGEKIEFLYRKKRTVQVICPCINRNEGAKAEYTCSTQNT